MSNKFPIGTLEDACQCPFYLKDGKGRRRCFIKRATSLATVLSIVEDNPVCDSDVWDEDCEDGLYENCSVLPLLYDMSGLDGEDGAEDADAAEEPQLRRLPANATVVDSLLGDEEYSPFDDNTEPAPPAKVAKPSKVSAAVEEPKQDVVTAAVKEPVSLTVKVAVRKVANVYRAQADALMYPTNQLLVIDDQDLNGRTRGLLQRQCAAMAAQYRKPSANGRKGEGIKLGQVYVTSNDDPKSSVVARSIYHAVVASQMRLVNPQAIKDAVTQTLIVADAAGVRVLAMLPCDIGTHDLYQTAEAQLNAIRNHLRTTPTLSLERIYIVIDEEDVLSQKAFQDTFDLIFG